MPHGRWRQAKMPMGEWVPVTNGTGTLLPKMAVKSRPVD